MWYSYRVGYYLILKRNENLVHTATQDELREHCTNHVIHGGCENGELLLSEQLLFGMMKSFGNSLWLFNNMNVGNGMEWNGAPNMGNVVT